MQALLQLAIFQRFLSKGVSVFGLPNVVKAIECFFDNINSDIDLKNQFNFIEVGSGNGFVSKRIEDFLLLKFENLNYICVDPEPNTFCPIPEEIYTSNKICKKPLFPTVDEMLKTEKNLIENCTLFLNWYDPNSTYDIESIQLLKPNIIISIHETSGLGGSEQFQEWFDQLENDLIKDYKLTCLFERQGSDSFDSGLRFCFAFIVKKDYLLFNNINIKTKIEEICQFPDYDYVGSKSCITS